MVVVGGRDRSGSAGAVWMSGNFGDIEVAILRMDVVDGYTDVHGD